MKTAIVHDWLTGMRGGERVLEEILALVPDPTVFRCNASGTITAAPVPSVMFTARLFMCGFSPTETC